MDKKLDISSLKKAYNSFINILNYDKEIESNNQNNIFYAKESARAAVIQHFECIYELSWKIMKRFIEMDEGQDNSLTRKDFFRHAGERGLIDDFHEWIKFHQARNLTFPYI
jgi:nucleotidyltransferase substrate binding protein (TIGR01987 family)